MVSKHLFLFNLIFFIINTFKGLNFGFKLPETNSEQNNSDTSDILYLNLPKRIEIQDQILSNFEWSARTSNCLKRNGIELLSQLIQYTKFKKTRKEMRGQGQRATYTEPNLQKGNNLMNFMISMIFFKLHEKSDVA